MSMGWQTCDIGGQKILNIYFYELFTTLVVYNVIIIWPVSSCMWLGVMYYVVIAVQDTMVDIYHNNYLKDAARSFQSWDVGWEWLVNNFNNFLVALKKKEWFILISNLLYNSQAHSRKFNRSSDCCWLSFNKWQALYPYFSSFSHLHNMVGDFYILNTLSVLLNCIIIWIGKKNFLFSHLF